MEIIEKRLDEIRPYERNPRRNDAAVQYVAESIRQFGWKQPIVIDKDGVIVAGHTRYKAAQSLGLEKAPCVIADDLTPEQVKAYRLADNKVGEIAEWDFDALEQELEDIDLDMSEFGFAEDGVSPEEFGVEFSLPNGDKAPVQNMTFTFSDDEAEAVKNAIAEMKKSKSFERYNNPLNENGNGKALFLVVSEWQAQKT